MRKKHFKEMDAESLEQYKTLDLEARTGFYEQKRGLIEVSGREAVQFLNGMITNDVARLESFQWMTAAFPNAQGRLLALVRMLRFDDKFLFETEAATREKVYQNLFRFTFAGDFFVEDLSEKYAYLSAFGTEISNFKYPIPRKNEIIGVSFNDESGFLFRSLRGKGFDAFVPKSSRDEYIENLKSANGVEISEELYEVLRIERGIPLYGVDMDETTIVPELGIEDLISYNKGCYIGQEIIARIHFRGHIAKKFSGLIFQPQNAHVKPGDELKTSDGKNAGRITSVTFSPAVNTTVALGYVRWDYLESKQELYVGDSTGLVVQLPLRG